MRDVKQKVNDASSHAPGADLSPTDMDRIDALRYLVIATEREGARMMAKALRRVGLNGAQREVLEVARQHSPLTLAELGRLLVCQVGSPSRLVDGLVRRGLIDRRVDTGDKRVVMLSLTPAGEQALDQVYPINAIRKNIARQLTTEQIDQLIGLLAPIVANTPSGIAVAARFPAIWSTRAGSAPA
jgi:DNA-binding MarR family transcriptional regulator